MSSKHPFMALGVLLSFALVLPACEASGVGDPCVPEDEYSATFSGFSVAEVSTESRSFQCQTRLCLVNRFQGRVSCPYGQVTGAAAGERCALPGSETPVAVPVTPQLLDRRAHDSVYCSCRCDGPDPNARYCECPNGFTCSPVVPQLVEGRAQLPGSYCIREGSAFEDASIRLDAVCSRTNATCNDAE